MNTTNNCAFFDIKGFLQSMATAYPPVCTTNLQIPTVICCIHPLILPTSKTLLLIMIMIMIMIMIIMIIIIIIIIIIIMEDLIVIIFHKIQLRTNWPRPSQIDCQ